MTTTAEKVELLEAELRANQPFTGRIGVPISIVKYASVWTTINTIWALYLIFFTPKISTEKQSDGRRVFTYTRVGKWVAISGIFTAILLYLWECYMQRFD